MVLIRFACNNCLPRILSSLRGSGASAQQSLKSYMNVHWAPAPLPTLVSPFREWWADKVQKCPHSTILLKDLHVALDRARPYSKSMTMAFAGSLVEFELGLKWTDRLGCRYSQWKLPGYKLV